MDFSTDERISPTNVFPIKLRSSKPKYQNGGFYVQQGDQSTGYLAYADLDNIYIFYTDGKKDVTYIDIRKGIHRTISRTDYVTNLVFASGVKVGPDYFMISDRLNYGLQSITTDTTLWKRMTYKWTGKKSRIFKHKQYTVSKYTYACYASYNRSHFLRVGTPLNESKVMMIELESMNTTTLSYVPLFVGSFWGYANHRKTCSVTFDKQGSKSLIVIAKNPIKWGVVLHQLNLNSMQWSRAATNMKYYGKFHGPSFEMVLIIKITLGSLEIAKGIMYHFNILNDDQHFGYYYNSKEKTWKDLNQKQMKYNTTLNEYIDTVSVPIVTVPYFD